MILRFDKFIKESENYDNKFVGNSNKSNWSEEDTEYIETVMPINFTDKEVSAIKNIFSKSKRADVTRKIITYNLFSDQVDKICIEIYITRKGRKKPILNSTTFINKLEDEYYWLELKNVLTHNTYNFKCDGFEGLVETMKKLLGE
jgi:hypothetical protein